jgi:hypothetical protein
MAIWGDCAVLMAEGNTAGGVMSELPAGPVDGPARPGEPGHVRNLHARGPGEPVPARLADHRAGRSGNAEAVILG